MPLVFLPDVASLFLWGDGPAPSVVPTLARDGESWSTSLATADGVREVVGTKLPLFETMAKLAVVPAAEIEALPGSIATWVLGSKLAMDLVARERVVPTILRRGGRIEARWAAALAGGDDAAKVSAIAKSMPPAAHAVPAGAGSVWAPDALLRAYLDAAVDAIVRVAQGGLGLPARKGKSSSPPSASWGERWRTSLGTAQSSFDTDNFAERTVVDDLTRWSEPALGARDRLRGRPTTRA